jgi:hypothetical protein
MFTLKHGFEYQHFGCVFMVAPVGYVLPVLTIPGELSGHPCLASCSLTVIIRLSRKKTHSHVSRLRALSPMVGLCEAAIYPAMSNSECVIMYGHATLFTEKTFQAMADTIQYSLVNRLYFQPTSNPEPASSSLLIGYPSLNP